METTDLTGYDLEPHKAPCTSGIALARGAAGPYADPAGSQGSLQPTPSGAMLEPQMNGMCPRPS